MRRPPPPRAQPQPVPRDPAPAQTEAPSGAEPSRPASPTGPVAATQPSPARATNDPNAVPAWQGRIVGQLQRAKRYPDSARAAGEEGVAVVSFTIDRAGQLLALRLVRSSGSQALDQEAVALVRRAEPLPAPPPEMAGQAITLTVPIRFSLQ